MQWSYLIMYPLQFAGPVLSLVFGNVWINVWDRRNMEWVKIVTGDYKVVKKNVWKKYRCMEKGEIRFKYITGDDRIWGKVQKEMKDHFFSSTLPSFATPPCSLPHPILFCLQVDEVPFQGPKGSSQRKGSSRRKKLKHKRKCERAVVSAVVPQEKITK